MRRFNCRFPLLRMGLGSNRGNTNKYMKPQTDPVFQSDELFRFVVQSLQMSKHGDDNCITEMRLSKDYGIYFKLLHTHSHSPVLISFTQTEQSRTI